MPEPWRKLRNALAEPVKQALDRRYVRHAETARIEARVEGLVAALSELQSNLRALRETAAAIERFLGKDTPAEMRHAVIDSRRLVLECAQAIELLSQKSIVLRGEIDQLSRRPV